MTSDEMRGLLGGAGIPADHAAMLVRDMEAVRGGFGARITDDVARDGRAPTSFQDAGKA